MYTTNAPKSMHTALNEILNLKKLIIAWESYFWWPGVSVYCYSSISNTTCSGTLWRHVTVSIVQVNIMYIQVSFCCDATYWEPVLCLVLIAGGYIIQTTQLSFPRFAIIYSICIYFWGFFVFSLDAGSADHFIISFKFLTFLHNLVLVLFWLKYF